MAKGDILDEFGNLTDPSTYQWGDTDPTAQTPPPKDLRGSGQGITDPPMPAQAPANTGAITDPNDPRLSNGAYASDPNVLSYINNTQGYGAGGNYQGQGPTPPAAGGAASTQPTGGNLSDPSYASQFVTWAASQPGVNPSVKNDPGYWIGRFTSGAFGNDQNYALSRMMQAEGAPESGAPAAAGAPGAAGGAGGIDLQSILASLMNRGGGSTSSWTPELRNRINAMLDANSKPVSADDPIIHNQTDAYQGDIQRSIANFREMAAERAHAQGVGTGAFDSQIGNAIQSGGRSVGKFTGDLMAKENDSRRALLSDTLGKANALDLGQQAADTSATSVGNQDTQFYDAQANNMASHAHDLDTILSQLLLGA